MSNDACVAELVERRVEPWPWCTFLTKALITASTSCAEMIIRVIRVLSNPRFVSGPAPQALGWYTDGS